MRRAELVCVVAAVLALALLVWAWVAALSEGWEPPALHKNAYWPFSVETSIKDKPAN